jgi:hypothetical protein
MSEFGVFQVELIAFVLGLFAYTMGVTRWIARPIERFLERRRPRA